MDVVRTAVPPAPLVRTCGESSPPHLIPWIDPAVADGVAQAEHFNDFQLHQTARLAHMLLLYASFDPECNYCQGMSDLALPFVLLFPEDWLAFWCFERLMRQARHNFREDELGVKLQLDAIRDTLAVVDPQIFGHIEGLGVREYHFAFRMVLVMLRRELSLESALRVWEQVWAIDGLNEHFVSVEVSSGDSVVMDPGMLTFVVAAIISRCGGAVRGCAGQEDLLQLAAAGIVVGHQKPGHARLLSCSRRGRPRRALPAGLACSLKRSSTSVLTSREALTLSCR